MLHFKYNLDWTVTLTSPPLVPPVGVCHVKDDLARRLLEDGYRSVEEAVGVDVDLSV